MSWASWHRRSQASTLLFNSLSSKITKLYIIGPLWGWLLPTSDSPHKGPVMCEGVPMSWHHDVLLQQHQLISPWTKWPPFHRRYFQMHFRDIITHPCPNTCKSILTHWGQDKMAGISQTTCSNTFCWMNSFVFWLKFHWSLFQRVQLTITQHWFR